MTDASLTPLGRFKRLLAQTTKALSAKSDTDMSFGGEAPKVTGEKARIPAPHRRIDREGRAVSRGHADKVAMRLAHHDALLHQEMMPTNSEGATLYRALEDVRVEALGVRHLEGVAANLDACLDRRLAEAGFARVEDRQDVPVADLVALLAREKLTSRPTPEAARPLVDEWRSVLESKIGRELDALAVPDAVADQCAFARRIHDLLTALDLGDAPATDDEEQDPLDDADDNPGATLEETPPPDEQPDGESPPDDSQPEGEQTTDIAEGFSEASESDVDFEADTDAEEMAASILRNNDIADADTDAYKVYTRRYDETISALDLCEPAELERLRGSLDAQLEGLQSIVTRLANRLQRRLLAQQKRDWQFDVEEGILDAARLARVVTDPMQPLSFKRETDRAFKDTTVTLLIDNSGSMRGRPIMVAALCADILARTLERCGVPVEILGFTTKAWKGGESREQWVTDGRPGRPGRLNDLRHIVYKPANVPWRRAKTHLGLMLKEGLLKENIDGEALTWAYERMLHRAETRRILMVISDGAPVDDTTTSANGGGYLDRHLRKVIEQIERTAAVELCAIGIGHDVTRFYRRAVTIADVEQLGGAMVDQLVSLFDSGADSTSLRRTISGVRVAA